MRTMGKLRERSREHYATTTARHQSIITSSNDSWIPSQSFSVAYPTISSISSYWIKDYANGKSRPVDGSLHIIHSKSSMPVVNFSFEGGVELRSGYLQTNLWLYEMATGEFPPPSLEPIGDFAFNNVHLSFPPLKESKGEYVTKMAARLNPSKPYVDLGVSAAELVGAPVSIFKHLGRSLAAQSRRSPLSRPGLPTKFEDPGGTYLRLQFGIMPIIRDVQKLIELTNEVEKKLDKIRRLKEHGFLRASSKKFPETHTQRRSESFRDAAGGLWDITTVKVTKRWCTLYYTADSTILPEDDKESRKMATAITFGATLDGTTLWNAMPWSWLLDWFTNLGDLIEAKRNTIGASLTKSLVMETIEYETTVTCIVAPPVEDFLRWRFPIIASLEQLEGGSWSILDGGTYSFGSPYIHTVTTEKTREVVQPSGNTDLALSNIFDSGFRSSIIAALALKSMRKE